MTERSLRVLFVLTQPLDPHSGGVQMSTCKLGRHFANLGHQVGVFSFADEGHAKMDFGSLWHARSAGGQNARSNLEELGRVVGEFAPAVVINQMPYERAIGKVLAHGEGFVLLGCLRNTLFSVISDLDGYIDRAFPGAAARLLKNPPGRLILKALHRYRHRSDLREILRTYDRFVMFASPNLQELSYFLPKFDRRRIALIPNSIPSVMDDLPKKEKRILWLGRLDEKQKRASLLLPIWQRASKNLPDWQFDVVGEGPLKETLERQSMAMGLERIEFHGRQSPDAFYRRSALFFMTSAFEGFPNTLVEAKSFGCVPLVFDSYPMAGWLIQNEIDGCLISPFDVERMASCMAELALDGPRREKLAAASLGSARQFEISNVGVQWETLLEEELLKSSSRNRRTLART